MTAAAIPAWWPGVSSIAVALVVTRSKPAADPVRGEQRQEQDVSAGRRQERQGGCRRGQQRQVEPGAASTRAKIQPAPKRATDEIPERTLDSVPIWATDRPSASPSNGKKLWSRPFITLR